MPYKPTHANGTFTKFGAPEIDKLYNDRYRIVVRCNVKGVDSKWHYSNVENFWKDFGSLYESPLQVDGADVGWEPATGETYPNMRLIEVSQNYPRSPNDGAPVLEFTYETLTGSYLQDADDKVDHELNGLRRVTRTVIAKEDSSYAKVVGTDTIDHTGRGYSSETLTLASAEEVPKRENEGGFTRIQETWLEAGTLRVRRNDIGQGRFQVQTTFLITEGSTVGPITSKDIQNFEGLKTIVVTTLQDKDGNSIANGGSNLILEHEVEVDFRYPGEVSIGEDTGTVDIGTTEVNFTNYYYSLRPPVSNPIEATRYVIYQTSNEIVAGDLVYDGAQGRWKPDDWAIGTIEGLEAIFSGDYSQLNSIRGGGSTRVFSNYTAVAPLSESGTAGWTYDTTDPNNPVVTIFTAEGQNKIGPWSISVSGGPGRPDGNKYVIGIDLDEEFTDTDGTKYYKKEIIVATIPTRP